MTHQQEIEKIKAVITDFMNANPDCSSIKIEAKQDYITTNVGTKIPSTVTIDLVMITYGEISTKNLDITTFEYAG